ncbi:hypothetical protein BDQ12DRAFT_684693 [Crucibulum laeve]|uniref:Uncharacterized protein n=1 Tax=Crucibulum laeve TaxID=68775 RepID=A0A5C3LXY0_9AGAR|nr:hypothetical protein BDQ12DRAFT_684693 [Crucibulum laeve]
MPMSKEVEWVGRMHRHRRRRAGVEHAATSKEAGTVSAYFVVLLVLALSSSPSPSPLRHPRLILPLVACHRSRARSHFVVERGGVGQMAA